MSRRTTTEVAGSAGGQAVVRKYGRSHMAKIGSLGGNAVVDKYGTNFLSLIGSLANPNLSETRRTRIEREINRTVQ